MVSLCTESGVATVSPVPETVELDLLAMRLAEADQAGKVDARLVEQDPSVKREGNMPFDRRADRKTNARSKNTCVASAKKAKSVQDGKRLTKKQIMKEKKGVLKVIQAKLKGMKFYPHGAILDGSKEKEIKFSLTRFPPDAAEELLGSSQDMWAGDFVENTRIGLEAMDALIDPLSGETVNGELWTKGRGSKRLGSTPLMLKKLTLSYDLKTKRLTGIVVCENHGNIMCDPKRRGMIKNIDESSDEYGF